MAIFLHRPGARVVACGPGPRKVDIKGAKSGGLAWFGALIIIGILSQRSTRWRARDWYVNN